MLTLHDRLRAARAARGKTQQDVAKAIGKSRPLIASWEASEEPSLSDLNRVAAYLGVSAVWLTHGVGVMISDQP